MRLGVLVPHQGIGRDAGKARAFAEAVDDLEFDYVAAIEHIVGADPDRPAGWTGPYDDSALFHEPMVFFGFLAALMPRIEFATTILVLPQRQVTLVAKQAAEVDILTGGRLRLGVGIGWNEVEYEALGQRFSDRGRRIEEQVALLRLLWTSKTVDFRGRWHHIDRAGINPLPLQRPIPIWMGGEHPKALRRIARIADGWVMPATIRADAAGAKVLASFLKLVHAAGRNVAEVGVEAHMSAENGDPEVWEREVAAFREMGVTHIHFGASQATFTHFDHHLSALRSFRRAALAATR